jgi:CheY-like chemotaxis protein
VRNAERGVNRMINADVIPVPERPTRGVSGPCRACSVHLNIAVKRKRILVLDDDTSVLSVTSQILSCLGYDVVAGRNGTEGLALYREDPCDIILTDLDMPTMDGLTLARHVKADYPIIPVVLMTGDRSVRDNLSTQIQEGLIDHFFFKPVRMVELRRTIQRLSPP